MFFNSKTAIGKTFNFCCLVLQKSWRRLHQYWKKAVDATTLQFTQFQKRHCSYRGHCFCSSISSHNTCYLLILTRFRLPEARTEAEKKFLQFSLVASWQFLFCCYGKKNNKLVPFWQAGAANVTVGDPSLQNSSYSCLFCFWYELHLFHWKRKKKLLILLFLKSLFRPCEIRTLEPAVFSAISEKVCLWMHFLPSIQTIFVDEFVLLNDFCT